jgi:tRNA 2-thiouridine synthesizing protein A
MVGDFVQLDARGMRCPWPALRLARAMRAACAVEMLSDDPRAAEEVQALADQHRWDVQIDRQDGTVRLHVKHSVPA